MKRRFIAICILVLVVGLAVPVSVTAAPVGCSKKVNAYSRYVRSDSVFIADRVRADNFNECFDALQGLFARLNKECKAQPEAPKPEASAKPQPPAGSEAPTKPQPPTESNVPVKSKAPKVTPPVETPRASEGKDEAFSAYAQQALDLVNEQRAANGLSALTLSSGLSTVAQAKAQDMKNNNYFSHTSPTYGSPFEMMKTFGITFRTAGENIAMGYATPKAVVNAWMNSPGHRANILNANYTQMGIGYVESGNYWCQMFIG